MKFENDRLILNIKEYETYGKYFEVDERKKLVGEVLAGLRKVAKLSQKDLADYLDIKPGTYSTYENGTRECPAEIIVRLSILYDVPTDTLLQVSRYRWENYLSIEQFKDMDKDIADLKNWVSDKDLNPDFQSFLTTMTDAFETMSEQLKAINEKAIPKGQ